AARRDGRMPAVSIETQANSVIIKDKYKRSLKNRDVVVFDDFTTVGYSLDWARNLLRAAGAASIVLVSIGKYSSRHALFAAIDPSAIKPFTVGSYKAEDFSRTDCQLTHDEEALRIVTASFQAFRDDTDV